MNLFGNSDLQTSIVDAVRSITGFESTRIAGFLRIECGSEDPRELYIDFNRLNESSLSPVTTSSHQATGSDCDVSVDSGIQISDVVTTSTPDMLEAMPKVNRRKAYLPKRVIDLHLEERKEGGESSWINEDMDCDSSPSLPVFPSPTYHYLPSVSALSLSQTFGNYCDSSVMKARILSKSFDGKRRIKPKPMRLQGRPLCGTSRSACPTKRSQNKEFSCNQCVLKFRSLGTLTDHTNEAHGCFRCMECNAKFTQRSNLQRHTLKHLGYKPFKCRVCEKEYYRKDHLVRHIEITHPGSSPRDCIVNVLATSECLRRAEEERLDGREKLHKDMVVRPEQGSKVKWEPPRELKVESSGTVLDNTLKTSLLENIFDEPQDLSMNSQRSMKSEADVALCDTPKVSIKVEEGSNVYDFST